MQKGKGDIKNRTKKNNPNNNNNNNNNNSNIKTRTKMYVIQALELHGCMFPGSPLPHPENDQWKHTMFTNVNLYFSYVSCQNHTGNI